MSDLANKNPQMPPGDIEPAGARNRRILMATALTASVALVFATLFPKVLVPAILSQFLMWAALASGLIALIRLQGFRTDRLTFWDQSMILLWFSIGASLFIDQAALKEYLEAIKAGAAALP